MLSDSGAGCGRWWGVRAWRGGARGIRRSVRFRFRFPMASFGRARRMAVRHCRQVPPKAKLLCEDPVKAMERGGGIGVNEVDEVCGAVGGSDLCPVGKVL